MIKRIALGFALMLGACKDPGATPALSALHVDEKPGVGLYVSTGDRRALYVLSIDESGQPSCFSNCSVAWPPAIVDTIPTDIDSRIERSKLGMTRLADGRAQLTFNRKPLYYADADRKPGDTWGHNAMSYGGRFSLVSPNGTPIGPPR